jgi:anti-sigma regulatory factor (Ser/Thr protein kinase)
MPDDLNQRRERLARLGATGNAVDELISYDTRFIDTAQFRDVPPLPLGDEEHIEAWEAYAKDAETEGAVAALAKRLPQLRFPVREGMSDFEPYRAATRKGIFPERVPEATGVQFTRPEGITLSIRETIAGRIPIIVAEERSDFELLVQAFTDRNEPKPVPTSMGACIVTGLNNWDRVHARKRAWREENPAAPDSDWSAEFKKMVPQKHLYQDRFIILSSGFYSGVSAEAADIPSTEWKELSIAIRREHESVHYFTHRILGAMRNNLLDETIADYAALVSVFGHYRPLLAKHFFGLEDYPEYRAGGRLENYIGSLGPQAFRVLQAIVVRAIDNLGKFDMIENERTNGRRPLAQIVIAIGSMTLDELACEDIDARVDMVRAARAAHTGEAQEPAQVEAPPEPAPVPVAPSSTVEVRFKATNDDDGMASVMGTFESFSSEHGLSAKLVATMNMALDELVSNIIKYGYDDDGHHEIDMRYAIEDGVLITEIVDDGLPFNMLEKEDPDLSLSIEEKPIGGLGVYLVKQLTDSQHYERKDDRNRLVLRKRIEEES